MRKSSIGLLLLVAAFLYGAEVLGQDQPVTISLIAQDHYTASPLDSVAVSVLQDGAVVATGVTDAAGMAVLEIRIVEIETGTGLPQRFTLSANYPNPFRDQTRVDVGIPQEQTLRVSLFNLLGQRIATEELLLAAGHYALQLSLGRLPDGHYFVRVDGAESHVTRMVKVGGRTGSGGELFRVVEGSTSHSLAAGSAAISARATAEGYVLRADRKRYSQFEQPYIPEGDTTLTLPLMRVNRVVFLAEDAGGQPVSRELQIIGDRLFQTISAPDTVTLFSGVYRATSDAFSIDRMVEVASGDSTFVLRPVVPGEAHLAGHVATDALEFVIGALVSIYKDGALHRQVSTNSEGRYESTLFADGSVYSLVASAPPNGDGSSEEHQRFSNDAQTLRPQPGGSYEIEFLLRSEQPLLLRTVGTDTPHESRVLVTPDETVIIANIPADLDITGGSARAYSPSADPDAFPGDFATRQEGLESGLISGGFVSVNLERENESGETEAVSHLRTPSGDPVRVRLRFKLDPEDWHVIQSPEHFTDLPGFRNRPDTLDVPLYYYDEVRGDWILAPKSGWLESGAAVIRPHQLQAIQLGSFEGDVYVAGDVDHFSWYNLDFPSRDACVQGRLVDQHGNPIKNKKVTLRSMPGDATYSSFSNVIEVTTNDDGFFRATLPRTEQGPGDDWNNNGRVDNFRFQGQFNDKSACEIHTLDNNGRGFDTPDYPSTSGCLNLGRIRTKVKEAKKVNFEITFIDKADEDYPLTVSPASNQFPEFAFASLQDNRVPVMSSMWNCACGSSGGLGGCVSQTTMDVQGRAFFSIPVLEDRDDQIFDHLFSFHLTGRVDFRQLRPDLGLGAFEFAGEAYYVPEGKKKETIKVNVGRRGPPRVQIVRMNTESHGDSLVYHFAPDDLVTLEAKAWDIHGGNVDQVATFYWSSLQRSFLGYGRTLTLPATDAFGSGPNLAVTAHAVHQGYEGTDTREGVSISDVQATFSVSPLAGVANTAFTFDASNTPGNIVSYVWDFGDGTGGNGPVVNRTYNVPDTFAVRLTVENANGELGWATRSVTTTGVPAAAFTATRHPTLTNEYTFDASASMSPTGSIVAWRWEFGDGKTGQGETISHTYGTPGWYVVRLTVEDDSSRQSSTTLSVRSEQCTNTVSGPVVIRTQDDLDALAGVCAVVGGGLSINSPSLVSLAPLADLAHVEGNLSIFGNAALINIAGLNSLSEIHGDLTVSSNQALEHLDGFARLRRILGSISVANNDALVTLTGFGDLEEVGRQIRISRNPILNRVESFPNLRSVEHLFVDDNPALMHIEGFRNVPSLDILEVYDNASLMRISGFDTLVSISRLDVYNNPSLLDLVILDNVAAIDRVLISENTSLTSAGLFSGVERMSAPFSRIVIGGSPSITSFESFPNLVHLDGQVNLWGLGASQCELVRFVRRIEDADGITGTVSIAGNGNTVSGNHTLNSAASLQQLEGVCGISGSLTISGSSFTSLAGLDSLMTIQGGLTISLNPSLTSLAGLHNVVLVGNVTLNGNSALSDITALQRVRRVSGLTINGNGALNSLEGLHNISRAWGLQIQSNVSLADLAGLRGLRELNGGLTISGNQALQSLQGLEAISVVPASVWISNQPLLADLAGLDGLERVTGDLSLSQLSGLTSLNGLSSLETVTGTLSISHPASLASLDGLASLQSVGFFAMSAVPGLSNLTDLAGVQIGSLHLGQMPDLESLSGLEHLTTIPGNLFLSGNAMLRDLTGLNNLEAVMHGIQLNWNDALESLAGLENLRSVNSITIQSHPALRSLEALSSLAVIPNWLTVSHNEALTSLQGLHNLAEIRNLTISDMGALSNLNGLSSLREVTGQLQLARNDAMTSLAGLPSSLTKIEDLTILDNPLLVDLAGLEHVQEVTTLRISGNEVLETLSGVETLASARSIMIENNLQLQSLAALQNLTSVRDLHIHRNRALADLEGLHNLVEVREIDIGWNASLSSLHGLRGLSAGVHTIAIGRNDLLTSLQGLGGVGSMTGDLRVYENPAMTSLSGLGDITSVRQLTIRANPVLKELNAVSKLETARELWIEDNGALSKLGLSDLRRVDQTFIIRRNPSLPECEAETLHDQVQSRDGIGGYIEIRDNNPDGVCEVARAVPGTSAVMEG
jgi:hypothetical protein